METYLKEYLFSTKKVIKNLVFTIYNFNFASEYFFSLTLDLIVFRDL